MVAFDRRSFLQGTVALSWGALGARHQSHAAPESRRRFTLSLNPFAIGVQVDQKQLVEIAHRHGFEAISAIPRQLAAMSDGELRELLADMKAQRLVWGAAGLPVDFRRDETRFQEGLQSLPQLASALQKAGVTRVSTWIMPTHADLTYLANFRLHTQRLQKSAEILDDYGLRLGLEYVGPRTLMNSQRFPFIHSLAETRDLIEAIGRENVGVQLDSFHWYCAGETEEDLLSLANRDVVVVDLNDARAGVDRENQLDNQRELPSATGVIDLEQFLGALVKIGYDGPVRAEPFNQKLRDMEDEEALQATYRAMKQSFDLV